MTTSPHVKARSKWFQQAEAARKKARRRPGFLPVDTPPPPCSPREVHALIFDGIHPVGMHRAMAALQVNKSTISRWLTGKTKIPRAAVLVLEFMANGVPPGCSDDWRGFAWSADGLITSSGYSFHVQDLIQWAYVRQLETRHEARIVELEAALAAVTRLTGAANDGFTGEARPAIAI
jgi:hypothetical protein